MKSFGDYLAEISLSNYQSKPQVYKAGHMIEVALSHLEACSEKGKRIFIIGNGGSCSTASHITNDFVKGCGMTVIPVMDCLPLFTAYSNDVDYKRALACILEDYCIGEGDILISISTSGVSENIIQAMHRAREAGARVIGFTGEGTSNFISLCDAACIQVSWVKTTEQIEDLHLAMLHFICSRLRRKEEKHLGKWL